MVNKIAFICLLGVALMASGCQRELIVEIDNNLVQTGSVSVINKERPSSSGVLSSTAKITLPIAKEAVGLVVPKKERITIPASFDNIVPFVSQAPLRDWSMPYQEACEEASMISADKFLGRQGVEKNSLNKELLDLIAWEEKNSYPIDVNASDMVKILRDYFGIEAKLFFKPSVDLIKYELSQGRIILVPTSGRDLGNPYFHQPGPIYHMLVIRGYNGNNFITNDVGTNTKGEAMKYNVNKLMSTIHDWNYVLGKDGMTLDEMRLGESVIIVINGYLPK
ncbi:MAG: C39 family peptidase [bacterium]